MKNLTFKIKELDLHGVKHMEVEKRLENYVLIASANKLLPLKIITGNSDIMKLIVINFLDKYKFKYRLGDYFNQGYIIVLK